MPEAGNALANLNRTERAAILLMSLGEKDAAEILKHMGPKEVQRVGSAMATLASVNQTQVEGVVSEFLDAVSGQTGMGLGADDYIRNMLTQALGQDKAGALIDRILLGGNTTGLDSLKWMEPRQVADLIRHEHPQIQAIVVSYLDADQSAEVLSLFDEKVVLDIIMRVASNALPVLLTSWIARLPLSCLSRLKRSMKIWVPRLKTSCLSSITSLTLMTGVFRPCCAKCRPTFWCWH